MVENVERRAKSKSTKLPVWSDELYLELHRGTYTTHGWIKKANRDAERLLYETELLCSLAMVSVQQYPTHEIETTWKKLLLNQFHDIVPGTAIADAYVDARKGFDEIGATCASLKAKALSCFVQAQGKAIRSPRSEVRERRFVVFNTQCFARSEYLLIRFQSKAKRFLVLDEQSRIIKSQFISSAKGEVELLCYIEDIGPFSSTQLNVYEQKGAAIPTVNERWQKKRFQSSFYRVQFGADGTIISLYDKILKRELIAKGKRANELQTFKDAPKLWDAWEIDPNYQQQQLGRLGFVRAEVVELGSLRAVIRVEHESKSQKQRAKSKGLRGGTPSMISQDIVFYHASRRIDFVTKVNWHEERTLLKVAFPLNVKTDKATYETQFGALTRTSNPKSKADRAKYEVPAQQWADMSERKFGVSLLNDCKYGYDASGDTLRLTLIRSPHYPHPQEPWWLTDEAVTDQGIHTFTYSLYPHAGDWRDAATTQRARELNNPLIVVEGETKNKLPSLLSISHPNIIVDSVKKAEEGNAIVVRLHEAHGKKTKATIQFASQPIAIEETDLLENRTHKLTTRNSKLDTQFKPFEIKTLKLKP